MAILGSFHATSPDGAMAVSDDLLRIAGIEPGTLVPTFEALAQRVVPEDRHDLADAYAAAWSGDAVGPFAVQVRRPNGELRQVHLYARPSFDSDGRVDAVEGTVLDVTDVTSQERELQSDLHLNEIANRLARVGGWALDLASDELTWSDTHFDIFDLPRGETPTVDEALSHFRSPWRERLGNLVDRLIETGEPYDVEAELDTATGRRIWIRSVGRPRVDDEGNIVAVEGAIQDIDVRKRSEEALAEERHMNAIASDLAKVGGWSVDLKTNELTWSESVFDLHEVPRGETPTVEEAIAFFAPTSRPTLQDAFDRLVHEGEPYDLELQLDTAKGRRVWVRAVGQPRFDDEGNVIAVEGAAQDIDDRKRSEEALEGERRMSAMAGRVARVGGWSVELPSFEHTWSDMVFEIHGLPKGRAPSPEEGLAMYAPAWRPVIREAFDRLVQNGSPYDLELQLDRADGRRIWVRAVAQPVFDAQGELVSVEGAFLDIDAQKRGEQALEDERRMNAIASRLARVGGWSVELATDAVTWSGTVYDLFGLPKDVTPTLASVFGSFDDEDRPKMEEGYRRAVEDGEAYDVESQLITATGERRWIRTVGRPRFDDRGDVVMVEGAVQDIDARKRSEVALDQALRMQRKLMNTLPAQVAVLGSDGTILEVNERWRTFGRENGARDPTFGVGRNYLEVTRSAGGRDAEVARPVAEGLRDLLAGDRDVFSIEYPCHAPDQRRWFKLEARSLGTARGRRAVLMHVDVTENHEAQERLAYLAFHDPLTGLLNREGLSHELSARVDRAWPTEHVLVEFDLRDMTSVNDLHGFDAGDALLTSIASRLVNPSAAPSPELVARTGGDEFAFLIGPDAAEAKEPGGLGDGAVRAARALIDEAVDTFHEVPPNESVKTDARVGLTRLAGVPRKVDDLLREAQLALYEARDLTHGDWAEFSTDYEVHVRERRRLANELQLAIERDELRLHFHPTVETRTGRISSAEALVRWQHPERGLLPPGAFVPAAERSGLIVPLGRWVLDEACRKMALWRDSLQLTRIAVNASAEELIQPSYTAGVLDALERHALDPTLLTIEVTETALVRDLDLALEHLHALAEAGVRLALDDFGTGFASLAILKSFPFGQVKIDRMFVADMLTDAYSHGVVASVLGLATTIGATVVGEGVETEDQRSALVELGCEIAQGYYFCLPAAEEDFEWLLRTRPTLPLSASA